MVNSIYSNSLSCIKTNNGLSKAFPVKRGIRQGDGLSPLLFNIYINDIKKQLEETKIDPPRLLNNDIPCLLYADDLLLLSESSSGLQNALNAVATYCKKNGNWILT